MRAMMRARKKGGVDLKAVKEAKARKLKLMEQKKQAQREKEESARQQAAMMLPPAPRGGGGGGGGGGMPPPPARSKAKPVQKIKVVAGLPDGFFDAGAGPTAASPSPAPAAAAPTSDASLPANFFDGGDGASAESAAAAVEAPAATAAAEEEDAGTSALGGLVGYGSDSDSDDDAGTTEANKPGRVVSGRVRADGCEVLVWSWRWPQRELIENINTANPLCQPPADPTRLRCGGRRRRRGGG